MAQHFDPQNLVILQKEYLDKGITQNKLIGHLMGKFPGTITEYKKRLLGTYKAKPYTFKKHKKY